VKRISQRNVSRYREALVDVGVRLYLNATPQTNYHTFSDCKPILPPRYVRSDDYKCINIYCLYVYLFLSGGSSKISAFKDAAWLYAHPYDSNESDAKVTAKQKQMTQHRATQSGDCIFYLHHYFFKHLNTDRYRRLIKSIKYHELNLTALNDDFYPCLKFELQQFFGEFKLIQRALQEELKFFMQKNHGHALFDAWFRSFAKRYNPCSAAVKKQLVQPGGIEQKKTVTAKMQEGEDVSPPSILDKWCWVFARRILQQWNVRLETREIQPLTECCYVLFRQYFNQGEVEVIDSTVREIHCDEAELELIITSVFKSEYVHKEYVRNHLKCQLSVARGLGDNVLFSHLMSMINEKARAKAICSR
jgi:hypothetical protein